MKVPIDREVYDKQGVVFWMDDDGILNAVGKNVPRTLDMVKENGEFLKTLLKGQKVCCLYDNTAAGVMDNESRTYVKEEMKNLYKAVAIVTHSSLGKMLGAIVEVITPPSIPIQMFTDENEAREWLKQFNDCSLAS